MIFIQLYKQVFHWWVKIQNRHISKVPKILVIGGSQGALYFDKTIQEILIDLNKIKKINIYQQVSDESKIDEIKKTYAKNNIPNVVNVKETGLNKPSPIPA